MAGILGRGGESSNKRRDSTHVERTNLENRVKNLVVGVCVGVWGGKIHGYSDPTGRPT